MGTTADYLMKTFCGLYGAALVFATMPANATIPLADSPLFLTVAVPPNITLTLDDSGSMARGYVPDLCGPVGYDCSALDHRRVKSSHFNPIYYDPTVKYPAPKTAAGVELSTSFTGALRNGFDPAFGTVDLSRDYRPTALLDLPPGATSSQQDQYMGHDSGDVRCSASTPRRCEYSVDKGNSWLSPPTSTSCSTGGDSNDRNRFCRGTQGSGTNPAPMPAYYYTFDSSNSECPSTVADQAEDDACYDLVIVSATSGPATVDLNEDGVVDAQDADERQNFANWYSFSRTRNFATQTAASLAFSDLDPSVRVAWQALNTCRGSSSSLVDTDCDGWRNNSSNVSNAIREFDGAHRTNFFTWLFQLPTDASTPLPAAMQRVGEYYRTSGENSPYDNDFTTSNSGELACRRNYHVLMTDGIWNAAVNAGNQDGASTTLPDGNSYTPQAPFEDSHSNTLADIAFNYWASDLRGTLDDELLPLYRDATGSDAVNYWNPRNDPATWQHMVNFTIGLGLTDYLSQDGLSWDTNMYNGSYAAIAAGTLDWPEPGGDRTANVSDLWHAAINSRGQFFSADDPASLSVAFRAALTAITASSGSAAALSANSTSLTGTSLVYQARFNQDWSGGLLALPVAANGVVSQVPSWDASELIPAHGSRNIFTHNGAGGIAFSSCSSLSANQQSALNTGSGGVVDGLCEARLEWLRGNPKDEMRSTTSGSLQLFRNRPDTVMGDIINSDPAYVGNVDFGYSGLPTSTPGQSSYASYVSGNASRTPMVYVGSNDGRLYAIRGDEGVADSGVEKFAYIPGGVYSNLSHLTDPSYSHRYYVDGSIIVRDAYLGGSWKTVLVAGLNGGGKSVYALDVTNPDSFSAADVMWEFDLDDDEEDLGLTFSRPQIAVLQNGQWVAVFGNGYNSADGGAHLFVVNLQTGALIRKITAVDNSGDDNNGLSTPLLVDTDNDRLMDAAYAGDLRGNLWKFDLSGGPASWEVANNAPLFRAQSAQAITAQPKITGHPNGGRIVLFGTGRYLANSDVFDEVEQTYYGIWDDDTTTSTALRSHLQEQTFSYQGVESGRTVRSVSNNTVDWGGGERGWYLDLSGGAGSASERVVTTSLVVRNMVIFSSIIPSNDPCQPGGTSWLNVLDVTSGGAFTHALFDLDGDGEFDSVIEDGGDEYSVNAVRTDRLGISNVPVLIYEDPTPEDPTDDASQLASVAYAIGTGTTGETETNAICLNPAGCGPTPTTGPVTRRSWIQIR